MKFVALICARAGSKGVPNKNIRLLSGIPLIVWSIKSAKKVDRISKVIASTDSEEIAQIAREEGVDVPFIRPQELGLDSSPEWLVWRHAINYLDSVGCELDGLVVIPPTAPLRSVEDINNCLNEFESGKADIIITVSEALHNPSFNMVRNNQLGYSSLIVPPDESISRRQDAPVVFDMTTVAYVVGPQFVRQADGIFDGRVRSVCVPRERALDIDTLFDFKLAEYLIENVESI